MQRGLAFGWAKAVEGWFVKLPSGFPFDTEQAQRRPSASFREDEIRASMPIHVLVEGSPLFEHPPDVIGQSRGHADELSPCAKKSTCAVTFERDRQVVRRVDCWLENRRRNGLGDAGQ